LQPKSISYLGLSITASLWLAAIVFSARVSLDARAQAPAPSVADEAGAALFVKMCSECHDSKRIVSQRRTSADWEDTLRKMIEEGAEGTAKDFETVFGYLVRTYGKVFINTAKADEIKAVLGLTAAEADAVVSYRTSNGAFADIEAVKKVPAIDVKKVDEHKEALAF
jgi:competence ComEA-like helix-hairpin-helix protein